MLMYVNKSMHCSYMFILRTYSNRTDEHLPDIMWCRDPFMEALNEIEDIN